MAEPEPSKRLSVDSVLTQIGLSSDFAQKVRFRGPVGKLALIALAALICIGGVGVKATSPTVQGLCAVLAALVLLSIAAGILWYSDKHPEEATLEGMEVVVHHQQKAAWAAAKGQARLPDSPIIPNPGGTPPQLSPSEEDEP